MLSQWLLPYLYLVIFQICLTLKQKRYNRLQLAEYQSVVIRSKSVKL